MTDEHDAWIAEQEAKLAASGDIEVEPPPPEYDPQLIPDESFLSQGTLDPALSELKDRIDRDVSLFDVYDHFCTPEKTRATPRPGQRDGIKFSCPSPNHRDSHPSAWARHDGLWYCGVCGEKGDLYNVVALNKGLDYRSDFREVMLAIADAFHVDYHVSTISGRVIQNTPAIISVINHGSTIEIEEPPPPEIPSIDWKHLFGEASFGRTWMEIMRQDDLPEEYYVWLALVAIGLACGRDVFMPDLAVVYPNLYICLFGPTGIGKSRAMRHLMTLLTRALPDDRKNPLSKGVFHVPLPGSPEALVDLFSRPIVANPEAKPAEQIITGYGAVRGCIQVDEYTSLLSKSKSGGANDIGSKLLTMFDCPEHISIYSRGSGEVVAKNVFCSVVTSTQPIAIRSALSYHDVISGNMNRYVFAIGTRKKQYSLGGPKLDLDAAVADLSIIRSWASMKQQIEVNDDAAVRFDEFFQSRIAPLDFEIDPILARIHLLMKKLMVIMAASDKTNIINVDIVDRVTALFDYLAATYRFVGGNVVSSSVNDLDDWLMKYTLDFALKTHTVGPTLRDIKKHLPKRFDSKQLVESLKNAVHLGVLVEVPIPSSTKGGRPTARFANQG